MSEEDNIHLSVFPAKCVVCNDILQRNEVEAHKCFSRAKNIFINESGVLVPQFENECTINPSTSTSSLTSISSSSSYHIPDEIIATQVEDIEEILIAEVQKRRELWDQSLPLNLRSRDVITSRWQEISKELNGVLTSSAASKKWRNLRDSYIRIRNEQIKKKSGSAATKPVKWKWYNHMQFLNDTLTFRSTTSNVSSNECSDFAATKEVEIDEDHIRPVPKRHKKSDDMLETITAIMKEPITVNVTSETQIDKSLSHKSDKKSSDNIDNILKIINNLLHEMPGNEGFNFGLKLLHLTTEKENEYRN